MSCGLMHVGLLLCGDDAACVRGGRANVEVRRGFSVPWFHAGAVDALRVAVAEPWCCQGICPLDKHLRIHHVCEFTQLCIFCLQVLVSVYLRSMLFVQGTASCRVWA